jgi:hypothetical protein
VQVEVPVLVKSRTVKSVPAAAPPLPSVMCSFDEAQDGAPAGAALVGAEAAGLEAWAVAVLAGVLAAETLDCGAEAGVVAWPVVPELCELQPAATIAAMATIPPVSEF